MILFKFKNYIIVDIQHIRKGVVLNYIKNKPHGPIVFYRSSLIYIYIYIYMYVCIRYTHVQVLTIWEYYTVSDHCVWEAL